MLVYSVRYIHLRLCYPDAGKAGQSGLTVDKKSKEQIGDFLPPSLKLPIPLLHVI